MKRLLATLLFSAAFLPVVTARAAEDGGEEAAIKRAALDYMEGWYEGDAKRMKRAIHPDLAKRRVLPGPLYTLTASRLLEMTRSGGGKDTPEAKERVRVVVLDVFDDISSARVESPHFYEYMHLAKIDGEWKIINILWKKNE
jgi:hypothetical protein